MKDVFLIGIELSHHGEERHFYLVFLVTDLSTGRSIVFPVSASPVIGVPNFEPAKLISAVGTFYFEGHPPLSPTRMQSTLGNQPLYLFKIFFCDDRFMASVDMVHGEFTVVYPAGRGDCGRPVPLLYNGIPMYLSFFRRYSTLLLPHFPPWRVGFDSGLAPSQ